MKTPGAIVAAGLLLLLPEPEARATETYVGAFDAESYDHFGWAMRFAQHGSYLIIGAPHEDAQGPNAGAAYVFAWDGNSWGTGTKLLSTVSAEHDECGASVAISTEGHSDWAFVGCPKADVLGYSNNGRVIIYKRVQGNQWAQHSTLSGPTQNGAQFGHSVGSSSWGGGVPSQDEHYLFVGSPYEDGKNQDEGRARMYKAIHRVSTETWQWTRQLTAGIGDGGPSGDDLFGYSIGMRRKRLIIGAPGHGDAGAAQIFYFDPLWGGWRDQGVVIPDDNNADRFGSAVDIGTQTTGAIIGDPYDDEGGTDAGAAYIFKMSAVPPTWEKAQKLRTSLPLPYDYFGFSVGIYTGLTDRRAIVGAFGDDGRGLSTGLAYVFGYDDARGKWVLDATRIGSDTRAGYKLGFGVDISPEFDMAGAPAWSGGPGEKGCGAVYIWD